MYRARASSFGNNNKPGPPQLTAAPHPRVEQRLHLLKSKSFRPAQQRASRWSFPADIVAELAGLDSTAAVTLLNSVLQHRRR